MTRLLTFISLLLPLLGRAQVHYIRLGDLYQLVLIKPAPVYLNLSDTLTTSPLQMKPGQVATIKAIVNNRWWVLWQALDYEPQDMYVRAADLAGATPYIPPSPRKK